MLRMIVVFAVCGVSTAPTRYHLTIIDTPSLQVGAASSINDRGEVVGTLAVSVFGRFTPFRWQQGDVTLLPITGDDGAAFSISENGNIAGENLGIGDAVKWIDGKEVPLFLTGSCSTVYAEGINDAGIAVGAALCQHNLFSAEWPGTFGGIGPATEYLDVNNSGTQVGHFAFEAVKVVDGIMSDVGPRNDQVVGASWANAVNAVGDIVGTGNGNAWVQRNGRNPLTLEKPSGAADADARGLNDEELIVGTIHNSVFDPGIAAIWRNESISILNNLFPLGPPLDFASAEDVNNHGQIVGVGFLLGGSDNQSRAYLLTPTNSLPAMMFLSRCQDGPDAPTSDGCETFDYDASNSVDLRDVSVFQVEFGSP